MNSYLERACQIFGNASCETASGADLFLMVVAATLGLIALCWIVARVGSATAS